MKNDPKPDCITCGGKCCNGSMFTKVSLTDTEAPVIKGLGGKVERNIPFSEQVLDVRGGCQFLKTGRCSIYSQRPKACREWVCSSLKEQEKE